jgi:mycoredoxin
MKLLVAALILIVLYQVWGKDAFAPKPRSVAAGEGAVVLYATDWCGYCRRTRAFLAEKGIEYTEYDIEKSEEGARQYKAIGLRGVPVLNVNGTIVHGYDPQAILAALK